MTTFDNLMARLAGDVLGAFGAREAAKWNVVDHPEVKAVFNDIRDALAGRSLGFNNTSVEHSPNGSALSVKYKFKSGKNGTLDLTWELSKALVEKAHEGLEGGGRRAAEKAAGMATAISALQDFARDPSGENKAELSDYGINVFREEARAKGYDRRKMLAIMEEEAKRVRGLTADEAGLRSYFRMSRAGSEHLMNRKMRLGVFCQLAALGHLRKGKVAGGPSWSDALFALKGQQRERLHKASLAFNKSFAAYLKKLGVALKSYGIKVLPHNSHIDTEMHGSDSLRMQGEVHFDLANFSDPKGRSFKDFMQDEFDVWGINYKNVWDFGEN